MNTTDYNILPLTVRLNSPSILESVTSFDFSINSIRYDFKFSAIGELRLLNFKVQNTGACNVCNSIDHIQKFIVETTFCTFVNLLHKKVLRVF